MGMNAIPVDAAVFKIVAPSKGGGWVRLPGVPAKFFVMSDSRI